MHILPHAQEDELRMRRGTAFIQPKSQIIQLELDSFTFSSTLSNTGALWDTPFVRLGTSLQSFKFVQDLI